jgi:spermidine synthase
VSGKKIRGVILSHSRDDCGEIVVAEEGATRSLYFGDVLQSSIRPDRPEELMEDYNRALMCALLFRDNPGKILLIGLGGCSLVHFLLSAFPECIIDAVEIREAVIDLAHRFFLLPKGNPHLRIFHASGQDFISHHDSDSKYDLIIVDAFDESGPALSLFERDFLTACSRRLNEGALLAVNLWSRPKDDFPGLYASLCQCFGNNTLKLQLSEAYWNTVVLAAAGPGLFRDLPSYRQRAVTFQRNYGINFPKYLKYLYWQNFRSSPAHCR